MFRKNKLLTQAEISYFCQQINMIIKAGLPTYYGISILRDEATDDYSRELYNQICTKMEKGTSLYSAIAETGIFPKYMLQMVHIGEETGRLEDVLDSLSVYYEREAEIKDGIKHAITYPLVMSVMMLAVIIVIITKVVPIFSDVYNELGSGLSGSALFLMNASTFLNNYLLYIVFGVFALIFLVFILSKTPLGKRFVESRDISRCIAASRFANCMYLALASNLDTDQGLDLAYDLVDNSVVKKCITNCKKIIKNGEPFGNAILSSGIFSRMYASIITIGYKTGAMDDVMLRISRAYEKDTDERLRRFISILEPTLIIILSFFIGLILISFLLPLLGIMSSIG